jgi:hypothetical protein
VPKQLGVADRMNPEYWEIQLKIKPSRPNRPLPDTKTAKEADAGNLTRPAKYGMKSGKGCTLDP